ncbi:MAG: 4'-phosphopantetheinyl transferase family protein [Myxococcota bacterium]
MAAFDTLHELACPHGILVGVRLPGTADAVAEDILERLHPSERAHAETLSGYRQPEFVGGRLAMMQALRAIGAPPTPVLPNDRGAPVLPKDFVGSITHKKTIAYAMVARSHAGTLGIDLEHLAPNRSQICAKVLRPEELAAIADLDDDPRWVETLKRFSVKESIYKALDPYVNRYVGFHEASVCPSVDGPAEVTLHLTQKEGPFVVEARTMWLGPDLLSSVRIRTS